VARFGGEGLPEPEPNPVLGFSAFDPGVDPEDPEPIKVVARTTAEKTTEEFPVPVDSGSPGAMPTSLVSTTASTPSVSHEIRTTDESASRPFLTFALVTLLAALGGAIFLALQPSSIPDLPTAPIQAKPTPPPPPPPGPATATDALPPTPR
jgi:hypothetical protein